MICSAFTSYGFSAPLFDKYSNLRIFQLKRRSLKSPFLVIASKEFIIQQALNVCFEILDFLLERAITVVLRTKDPMPYYANFFGKTAFRLANTSFLQRITRFSPITSTSVNISGKPNTNDIRSIIRTYKNTVDVIVTGRIKNNLSTIIELDHRKCKLIRKGWAFNEIKGLFYLQV